jgi:hypothetical protein
MEKEKQIFKRIKTIFNTEILALQDICNSKSVTPAQLKACHEEKNFAWELVKEPETNKELVGVNGYLKEDFTEHEAVKEAMDALNTFEGNLKTAHTETHYVFSKVRE